MFPLPIDEENEVLFIPVPVYHHLCSKWFFSVTKPLVFGGFDVDRSVYVMNKKIESEVEPLNEKVFGWWWRKKFGQHFQIIWASHFRPMNQMFGYSSLLFTTIVGNMVDQWGRICWIICGVIELLTEDIACMWAHSVARGHCMHEHILSLKSIVLIISIFEFCHIRSFVEIDRSRDLVLFYSLNNIYL